MEVEVSYLAVFLAAVSSMVVGSIWYARPVFGNMWIKLAKIDEKKMRSKGAWTAMAWVFLLSLLTAYVLAHVTYLSNQFYSDSSFMSSALQTAFWVWLGFVLTRMLTHNMFEQKPAKLNLLGVGNEFVTIMVMGLIIGMMAP